MNNVSKEQLHIIFNINTFGIDKYATVYHIIAQTFIMNESKIELKHTFNKYIDFYEEKTYLINGSSYKIQDFIEHNLIDILHKDNLRNFDIQISNPEDLFDNFYNFLKGLRKKYNLCLWGLNDIDIELLKYNFNKINKNIKTLTNNIKNASIINDINKIYNNNYNIGDHSIEQYFNNNNNNSNNNTLLNQINSVHDFYFQTAQYIT